MKINGKETDNKAIFAGLVLILFALNTVGAMTLSVSGSQFDCTPGQTVYMQFTMHNDAPEWVGTSGKLIQDEQNYGGSDKTVWSGYVSSTATANVQYTVPTTPGTYEVRYEFEVGGTGMGTTRVTFNVVDDTVPEDPVTDPVPDPTDPLPDPSIGDGTEEDPLDLNIGDLSTLDKIVLLIQLVFAWILGGTAA